MATISTTVGKLLRETVSDGTTAKTLDFSYDNVGMPYSLIYNDGTATTTYYYITNLQGDVMYLVDASGNEVAAYDYDPYGKVITSTGDLAAVNPLRYRGYYYDTETGFYYLQSRYYDPEICRFINADSYASTGQGYMGYNMFAYCNANPVALVDTSGSIPAYSLMLTDSGSGSFKPHYINNQADTAVANIRVGCKDVAWSGCGPVATYNALQTLGKPTALTSIIDYYDKNNDLIFDGILGILPNAVADYFDAHGYQTEVVPFTQENYNTITALSNTADASILWYSYTKGNHIDDYGAHFVEYHKLEAGGFVAVNSSAADGMSYFSNPYCYAYGNGRFFSLAIFIFDDRR